MEDDGKRPGKEGTAVRKVLAVLEEEGPGEEPRAPGRLATTLRLGLGMPLLDWQMKEDEL